MLIAERVAAEPRKAVGGVIGQSAGLSTSIAIFAVAAYGTVLFSILLLPETKGQAFK